MHIKFQESNKSFSHDTKMKTWDNRDIWKATFKKHCLCNMVFGSRSGLQHLSRTGKLLTGAGQVLRPWWKQTFSKVIALLYGGTYWKVAHTTNNEPWILDSFTGHHYCITYLEIKSVHNVNYRIKFLFHVLALVCVCSMFEPRSMNSLPNLNIIHNLSCQSWFTAKSLDQIIHHVVQIAHKCHCTLAEVSLWIWLSNVWPWQLDTVGPLKNFTSKTSTLVSITKDPTANPYILKINK